MFRLASGFRWPWIQGKADEQKLLPPIYKRSSKINLERSDFWRLFFVSPLSSADARGNPAHREPSLSTCTSRHRGLFQQNLPHGLCHFGDTMHNPYHLGMKCYDFRFGRSRYKTRAARVAVMPPRERTLRPGRSQERRTTRCPTV